MSGKAVEKTDRVGKFGELAAGDFVRFSRLIQETCGIRMPPQKKGMLEMRLRKRLRALGFESLREYGDFLFSPEGIRDELTHMIDVVTTNKSDFFREPAHFDILAEQVLPRLADACGAGQQRPLRVWSAGCAGGEEPFTLAMVLAEFAAANPGFTYSILATDISTRVLEAARLAIFKEEKVAPVPAPLRRKYLLRSRDRELGQVRIVPELRAKVTFRHLNFMNESYGLCEPLDVIFCRNVLIYFDRPTQTTILRRLCRSLSPGGYLFTGHSETISGMNLPLVPVALSVYARI